MNVNALKISLKSLVENGNRINKGQVNDMFIREYVDLYDKTKEYYKEVSNENLNILYKKLPDIKYQTFRNPYYLFRSFLLEKVKLRYSRVTIKELIDEVDGYPARSKYLLELNIKISRINDIIFEILKELETDFNQTRSGN